MAYVDKINVQGTVYDIRDGAPLLENIVDSDGHKRFIEGDITPQEIEGVNFVFAKWSLSGTHLMIVMAGNIDVTETLSTNTTLAVITNIPAWVMSKIYPIASPSAVVMFKDEIGREIGGSGQKELQFELDKTSNTQLNILYIGENYTPTATNGFRVEFDLLIDN